MQPSRRLSIAVLFVALSQAFYASGAEDTILVDAQINNQSVRFMFDTGAAFSSLFREAANRLGLKVSSMDIVEDCTLTCGKVVQTATFEVVESPYPFFRGDATGAIGWTSVSNRVFELDIEHGKCRISDDAPAGLQGWTKWELVKGWPVLVFERENGAVQLRVGVDTGFAGGIMLSSDRWQRWRKVRAGRPATVETRSSIGGQLFAAETFRAKKIMIGDLTVTDVPVLETPPDMNNAFPNCDAILGLFVFRRLKLIVDGKNGVVYTHTLARPSGRYDYNPLGADFVPENLRVPTDLSRSPDLVAHVAPGGPAARAGVQNGDVLLKVGSRGVDEIWRGLCQQTDRAKSWPSAGTKVKLTLRRTGRQYETTVTLKDLPAVE